MDNENTCVMDGLPSDLAPIVAGLRSGDLERQYQAMDEASDVVRGLAAEAVNTLINTSGRFPVAERLVKFGLQLRSLLEDLLTKEVDFEVKTYAAVILLKIGSKAGADHLLASLKRHDHGIAFIASSLANAQVREAAGPIEEVVRGFDIRSDPYVAATLIVALRKLRDLPDDLRDRFTSPEAPANVRLAVEWDEASSALSRGTGPAQHSDHEQRSG